MHEDELPIIVPEDTSQVGETGEGGESSESATQSKTASEAWTKEKKKVTKKDSTEQSLKKERAEAFNYTSDVFNGADMDTYKWSQTIKEVEIKVVLPENTKAKQVRVDIRSDYLKVEILNPERKV